DYDYTGGDADGGLEKLVDKRVALVGTGATGIQLVPHLGRDAQHLFVFQRTPSSVDARTNPLTDPDWAASLQPGWQEERKRNFHNWSPFVGVVFGEPDLVCDFWTELGRNLTARIAGSDDPTAVTIEQIMAFREEEDYKIMERLRRRVAEIVDDPDTAEALKPYYRFMCKRPTSSEQYLATFNRPNVTLVDVSASKGVERLTEKGIVADGVEYEVDCVVFASGFEISTEISRRYAIEHIIGRDGLSLFDYWQDNYKTLHGMTSRGFPNQFFMGFIQGGVSANTTAMFEQQAKHIAYIVAEAQNRGATTVEPSQEGQEAWVQTVRELAIDNSAFELSCTPGYYNNEGRGGAVGNGSFLGDFYSPGFYAFDELIAEWRDKGDLDGLVLGS
ncbi:MAG: flavin-containing monooxygenase, partial [Mycobacterium sp.]